MIEKIEKEVEINDPYELAPIRGHIKMWPSLGVQVLIVKVNEIIDWANEWERKCNDGK